MSFFLDDLDTPTPETSYSDSPPMSSPDVIGGPEDLRPSLIPPVHPLDDNLVLIDDSRNFREFMETNGIYLPTATGLCMFRIRDADQLLALAHANRWSFPLVVHCGLAPSSTDQSLFQRLGLLLKDYSSF
jgi:hypothetical protein